MATLLTVSAANDMPFIRCLKEEAYERRLTPLFVELLDTLLKTDPLTAKVVNLLNISFDLPFDSLWFIRLHRYWAKYQDFEMRLRSISLCAFVFFWLELF